MVSQVDEDEVAVVALAVHPSGDAGGLPHVTRSQLPAGMGPIRMHDAQVYLGSVRAPPSRKSSVGERLQGHVALRARAHLPHDRLTPGKLIVARDHRPRRTEPIGPLELSGQLPEAVTQLHRHAALAGAARRGQQALQRGLTRGG